MKLGMFVIGSKLCRLAKWHRGRGSAACCMPLPSFLCSSLVKILLPKAVGGHRKCLHLHGMEELAQVLPWTRMIFKRFMIFFPLETGSWVPVPGSPTDEESQIWAGPCFFPALLLSRLEGLVQSVLTHQLHQRPYQVDVHLFLTQLVAWFLLCEGCGISPWGMPGCRLCLPQYFTTHQKRFT